MNKDLNLAIIAQLERTAKEVFGKISGMWIKTGKYGRDYNGVYDNCYTAHDLQSKIGFVLCDDFDYAASTTIEIGSFKCSYRIADVFKILAKFYKVSKVRRDKQIIFGMIQVRHT